MNVQSIAGIFSCQADPALTRWSQSNLPSRSRKPLLAY
ncbi:hypothetical protein MOTT12_01936 [Mycobacterium intracellulare subsp. yongonense]|nr:hypothetical protein MOTT12_01936 [Mycobacterium intracellulare subsp. yongonense]